MVLVIAVDRTNAEECTDLSFKLRSMTAYCTTPIPCHQSDHPDFFSVLPTRMINLILSSREDNRNRAETFGSSHDDDDDDDGDGDDGGDDLIIQFPGFPGCLHCAEGGRAPSLGGIF